MRSDLIESEALCAKCNLSLVHRRESRGDQTARCPACRAVFNLDYVQLQKDKAVAGFLNERAQTGAASRALKASPAAK